MRSLTIRALGALGLADTGPRQAPRRPARATARGMADPRQAPRGPARDVADTGPRRARRRAARASGGRPHRSRGHRPASARSRTAPPPAAPRAPLGLRVLRQIGLAEQPVRLLGHPRIRERAIEGLLRRRRRDSLITGSIGVVVLLALLSIGVVRSPLLSVESVHLVGLTDAQEAHVSDLVGVVSGMNVLDVDLDEVAARVEAMPWVSVATVNRRLPSTVEVRVAVRHPVATVQYGGDSYLIDADGLVLERMDGVDPVIPTTGPPRLLPIVQSMQPPVVGRQIADTTAVAAAAVAGAMPAALDDWIVAYRTGPGGEVEADLRVPTGQAPAEFVAHLGRPEAIDAKAATLVALVSETVDRGLRPLAMDVRIPDRPVVR